MNGYILQQRKSLGTIDAARTERQNGAAKVPGMKMVNLVSSS